MDIKELRQNYLNLIKETEKNLKPCPHCGCAVKMFETEDGMGYDKELVVRIQCYIKDCYTHKDIGLISLGWSNEPDKAMQDNCNRVIELAERWNRRVK